jgi:hypothetical protein
VEEKPESTIIPEDTTSSVEGVTSTVVAVETSEPEDSDDYPTEITPTVVTETETETETETPTETPVDEDEPSNTPFLILGGTIMGSTLAAAAAVAYLKGRTKIPGNQLAGNVFQENVGMENPLYEGTTGQNENPLYEANVNFDSLEDNLEDIDAFA